MKNLYLLKIYYNLENITLQPILFDNFLFKHSKLLIYQESSNDLGDLYFYFLYLFNAQYKLKVIMNFFRISFLQINLLFDNQLFPIETLIFTQDDYFNKDKSFLTDIHCKKIVFSSYFLDFLKILKNLEQVHFLIMFLICLNYSYQIHLKILYYSYANILIKINPRFILFIDFLSLLYFLILIEQLILSTLIYDGFLF